MKTQPTTLTGARGVALETIRAVEAREAFLQPALEAAAARAGLDHRDRGLALELASGSLRWQRRLDHRLTPHLRRGLEETDAALLWVLRLAVYQLDFMDRVPAHAAVNEAVTQARIVRGEGGARLVNAVLRAVQQAPEVLPEGDSVAALGVRLSHPDWLVQRALDLLGPEEGAALLAAHNKAAPLTIRATVPPDALESAIAAEGGTLSPGYCAPRAFHLEHPAAFTSASFRDGLWRVQDEAAQLVSLLLDPQPGDAVWDVCAAPGGKTAHLWDLMAAAGPEGAVGPGVDGGGGAAPAGGGPRGTLLATDAHAGKVKRLAELFAGRAGLTVSLHDAKGVPPGVFDKVLLDAPCSGLGTLRRHPEIRWRRPPEALLELARSQRQMLSRCAGAVKPGGVLVYSVCTFTDEEGPDNVAGLLEERPDFVLEMPPDGAVVWSALRAPMGLRTWPHRHDMDGFFAARMRRLA